MTIFDRFFRQDPEDIQGEDASADELVAWANHPYHHKFLEWLDRKCDEPLELGDQARMLASAARINGFKEVRKHLRLEVERARAILASVQER